MDDIALGLRTSRVASLRRPPDVRSLRGAGSPHETCAFREPGYNAAVQFGTSNGSQDFFSQNQWRQTAMAVVPKFKVIEGWEKLPKGYVHKDVDGVATDSKDNVYLMTRQDARLFGQGVDLVADAGEQGGLVAAGEVGAADREVEEQVADGADVEPGEFVHTRRGLDERLRKRYGVAEGWPHR